MTTITLGLLLAACNNTDSRKQDLDTSQKRLGYALSIDFMRKLQENDVAIDTDSFILGARHMRDGHALLLSEEDLGNLITGMKDSFQQKAKAAARKNLLAGQAFLESNGEKPGVIVLPSGLQYKVLKNGEGESPTFNDMVETRYRGTLIDGREFDNSSKRGDSASFPVNGVIKGWTEALLLMKVGDKWQLFVPANLAYGMRKKGNMIEPNSALNF